MSMGLTAFQDMFPLASSGSTGPPQNKWKSTKTVSSFREKDVTKLEALFGKEFYVRPDGGHCVVLLGPISFRLVRTTLVSQKTAVRFHRNQVMLPGATEIKKSSFCELRISFCNAIVSRAAGGVPGGWKKEVAALLKNKRDQ